jgi:hypothetical protein
MQQILALALVLLMIQGAIGAFDVLYNHEWDARLPSQKSAALELRIHAIRSVLYAVLFAGIAWFDWHGFYAVIFALLIFVEILLTLWDFVVEDRTRRLSALERSVHTILAMNGGAYVVLLLLVMFQEWLALPAQLFFVDRGLVSWVLSAYALGVFMSGLRDGYASARLLRA